MFVKDAVVVVQAWSTGPKFGRDHTRLVDARIRCARYNARACSQASWAQLNASWKCKPLCDASMLPVQCGRPEMARATKGGRRAHRVAASVRPIETVCVCVCVSRPRVGRLGVARRFFLRFPWPSQMCRTPGPTLRMLDDERRRASIHCGARASLWKRFETHAAEYCLRLSEVLARFRHLRLSSASFGSTGFDTPPLGSTNSGLDVTQVGL